MGVDCTLLLPWQMAWDGPYWGPLGQAYVGVHLDLPRCREAWDALNAVPKRDLPGQLWEGLCEYDEEADSYHEGPIRDDRYGNKLQMARAQDVANALRPFTEAGPAMAAAVAYLDAIPAGAPVIPFWH